jgi:uncharacterized membrane protein
MLVERAFLLGGVACIAVGLVWLAFLASAGAIVADPFLAYPTVLFLLFGGMFVYTSRQARRDRTALLRMGENGLPPDPH